MTIRNSVIRKSVALGLIMGLSAAGALQGEPDSQQKSAKRPQTERKQSTSTRDAVAAKRALMARDLSIFIHQPAPTSPIDKRALREEGLARLHINQRGTITSVQILRSTGHRQYDADAADTFRRWRTRPGPAREVDLPLTAVMLGRKAPVRIPLMQGSMTSG
jgi:TonB family protein